MTTTEIGGPPLPCGDVGDRDEQGADPPPVGLEWADELGELRAYPRRDGAGT